MFLQDGVDVSKHDRWLRAVSGFSATYSGQQRR
jgi:hypothetical protein